MNLNKLKQAESAFLSKYPQGFASEEIKEISKKHKLQKWVDFSHEKFTPEAFENVQETSENMIRLVSGSSMVSVFEKPKFRDAVRSMPSDDKEMLVRSLNDLLFGDEARGFHMLLDLLIKYSLAKWTLISVFRCYHYPDTDLLFKPTTVKNIIKTFELEGLVYKPRPSYDFYVRYRAAVNDMKTKVDPSLTGSNAGFSGFLMMAMEMM